MGRTVVVSFENTTIKVIYASLKRKHVVVNDALMLRDDQFDDFLLKEKTKEFIVVNSFKDFFQDIIFIPPIKKGFIKKLLEAEIKKMSPFSDFSFLYTVIGEKILENKRMKKVFLFAVQNEELRKIINRFILKGKVIKAIFPDIFSLARQIESEGMQVLCVSEAGLGKNLFLIKDGRIQFIRTAQSLEHGVSDLDIQNINMTVNYCRQTLRINPSFITLIGSPCRDYYATADALIPIACLTQLRNSWMKFYSFRGSPVPGGGEVFLDFSSPLSALFISRGRDINLLTKEYRNFYRTKLFLQYSTLLFLTLSLIGIGTIGFNIKNIIDLKHRIDSIRMNLPDVDLTVSSYDEKRVELSGYMPFISFLKHPETIPDIQKFLTLLSGIKTDHVRIDSLSLTVVNNILSGELKGSVTIDGYAHAQVYFERLLNSLKEMKGIGIKSHGLELKDKSFHIEFEWNPQNITDFMK